MYNVVSLQRGRSRMSKPPCPPGDGARILFFTGVRYCREEDEPAAAPAPAPAALAAQPSERALEVAAH